METLQKMKFQPLAAGAAVALTIASAVAVFVPAQAIAQAPPSYGAQAAPACPNCGVVASVRAYPQKPRRSVGGMVGGGVLGAGGGNEIGNGSPPAPLGGAAGGAHL